MLRKSRKGVISQLMVLGLMLCLSAPQAWASEVMRPGAILPGEILNQGPYEQQDIAGDGQESKVPFRSASVSSGFKTVVKAIGVNGEYGYGVVLKGNGKVVTWGDNSCGQCNVPAGLSGVKEIIAGYYHNLALKEDGTVVAWGYNCFGQCDVPADLSGVKAIAVGFYSDLAIKEDGTVVVWGSNYYGECNVPADLSGVKAVAAGNGYYLALKEDGTVVAWGSNFDGVCNVPTGLSGVKGIYSAQSCYSVALKEDGTVVAWGDNSFGQCNVPTDLSGVKEVAPAYSFCVALKEDGTVVAWGNNEVGQCDVPSNLSGVKEIACKWVHTLALKEDGMVVAWGDNTNGQCNVPTGLSGVKDIVTWGGSFALKEDGTVIVWGNSHQSALSDVPKLLPYDFLLDGQEIDEFKSHYILYTEDDAVDIELCSSINVAVNEEIKNGYETVSVPLNKGRNDVHLRFYDDAGNEETYDVCVIRIPSELPGNIKTAFRYFIEDFNNAVTDAASYTRDTQLVSSMVVRYLSEQVSQSW